jgi:tricorn protease
MKSPKYYVSILIVCVILQPLFSDEARLFRFPDVNHTDIVFSYAADLWLVSRGGGIARRITSHDGMEFFPKFSPEGSRIAFSAEYDGNRAVYVIPATGGEPKQLTHYPAQSFPERMGLDFMVLGWYPDGSKIVYRSHQGTFNAWVGKLYGVSPDGRMPAALPVPEGGFTSFSPDGKKIAYNRNFREFRTWKRYRGGQALHVYIYDLENGDLQQVTDWEGPDKFPMWYEDKIYFVSDREGRENIFVYEIPTGNVRQVTFHETYDVKWPSLGPDAIVYEWGGYIYMLDLTTEEYNRISIQVPGDHTLRRTRYVSVGENITGGDIAPDGNRVVFSARGNTFTVPAKDGNTRNLTGKTGVHERWPRWSPDGKWIAYLSDATGEYELYIRPQDGRGEPVQLTQGSETFYFAPAWSPDSKSIAFGDRKLNLYYVDIASKRVHTVDSSEYWEIRQYTWSPDGRWIAYAKPEHNNMNSIFLYSLDNRSTHRVTDYYTTESNPAFDPDGKYLYFISNRDFNPLMAQFESNFLITRSSRPYLVTLRRDIESPFAPRSDEVKINDDDSNDGSQNKDFGIDLEGIGDRIVGFPVRPGNYGNVQAVSGKVLYISGGISGLAGPVTDEETSLIMYDLEEREEHALLSPVNGYSVSADQKKILYASRNRYGIVEVRTGVKVGDGLVNIGNMQVHLDPRAEWKQIFNEVWRLQRDFFYDPDMHGVDWPRMREKYAELMPHVAHRYDLTYVTGELISELGAGHAYKSGGDVPEVEPVKTGLLGAEFELDEATGYYKIGRIYEGENWKTDRRSPLTEPGIDVREGEFIIAIDGEELRAPKTPYQLLVNKAEQLVTLQINDRPRSQGAREVTVKTIDSETQLVYFNWVGKNRRYVNEKTGGRVGYVHLPNMSLEGLQEFVKYFYPQIRKEGLIIDVRYNGGGFVSEMILERLRRVLAGMGIAREGRPTTYPSSVFHGPMVTLLNMYSASDGDYFPYFFREFGLGPLIGTRSWGGVIGIRGTHAGLVDGGSVTQPEFSSYSLDREWHMENVGVIPDIIVDNKPYDEIRGIDAQLDRAIEEVLRKIAEQETELPPPPERGPIR